MARLGRHFSGARRRTGGSGPKATSDGRPAVPDFPGTRRRVMISVECEILPGLYDETMKIIRGHPVDWGIAQQTTSVLAVLGLVAAGLGLPGPAGLGDRSPPLRHCLRPDRRLPAGSDSRDPP